MSAQPLPTPTPASPASLDGTAGQKQADAQYYRQVLHKLIDMGTIIAGTVQSQAVAQSESKPGTTADPDSSPQPDFAARFERIARCVRRTILLARHVAEPPRAPSANATALTRTATRTRILRACEDSIARAAFNNRDQPGQIDAPALHAELLERLDRLDLAEDLDGDIATRPVPDIIRDICRDLGLGLDDMPGRCPAPRRTPADLATLRARAAATPGTQPSTPDAPPRASPPRTPRPEASESNPESDEDMRALCLALVRDG